MTHGECVPALQCVKTIVTAMLTVMSGMDPHMSLSVRVGGSIG
jgi:hypothetical protein